MFHRLPNKTYITHYKRQIVLNSAVINRPEYVQLKQLLERHEKITQATLDKDILVDQPTKDIVLYAFENLFDIAKNEWIAVRQNDIGNVKCSLCNEPNKQIFFIRNKVNGNTLNVGSSCIQHFADIRFKNGVSVQKVISAARKSNQAINRKIEFKKAYPQLDNKIHKYFRALNKSSLLLPNEIYSHFF